MFLIENVTPIIPTTTKSLAGTLTLADQFWIGKGVSAWRLDLPGNDRYLNFSSPTNGGTQLEYNLNFIQRFGGWVQLQYYWTEQIYTNINGGFEQAFGFTGYDRSSFVQGFFRGTQPGFTIFERHWHRPGEEQLESRYHPVVSAHCSREVCSAVSVSADPILPDYRYPSFIW